MYGATPQGIPTAEQRPTLPLWSDDESEPSAGRALSLGRSATYLAAGRGEIPTLRLGRRVVVPTAALRRMLQLDEVPVA